MIAQCIAFAVLAVLAVAPARADTMVINVNGITIDVKTVETNIVIFDISATGRSSGQIVNSLKENGILAIGFGTKIRFVTHCDVTSDDIDRTIQNLNNVIKNS